jgi:hypothetical protein
MFGPKKPKVTGGQNFVKSTVFCDVTPCSLAAVEERDALLMITYQKTALRTGAAVRL